MVFYFFMEGSYGVTVQLMSKIYLQLKVTRIRFNIMTQGVKNSCCVIYEIFIFLLHEPKTFHKNK